MIKMYENRIAISLYRGSKCKKTLRKITQRTPIAELMMRDKQQSNAIDYNKWIDTYRLLFFLRVRRDFP